MRVAESKVPDSEVKWRGATLTCPEKDQITLGFSSKFMAMQGFQNIVIDWGIGKLPAIARPH